MATTLNLRDHLGRSLANATPGTTDPALDFIGREVGASDVDFMGRDLVSVAWAGTTAFSLGDYVDGTSGELAVCTTAGTTDAGEPTWPAYGATVTDGTAVWTRVF